MMSNATFFSILGTPVIDNIVGTIVSICTGAVSSETVLSFSAKSFTAAALTWTVTSPSLPAFGVIVTS